MHGDAAHVDRLRSHGRAWPVAGHEEVADANRGAARVHVHFHPAGGRDFHPIACGLAEDDAGLLGDDAGDRGVIRVRRRHDVIRLARIEHDDRAGGNGGIGRNPLREVLVIRLNVAADKDTCRVGPRRTRDRNIAGAIRVEAGS